MHVRILNMICRLLKRYFYFFTFLFFYPFQLPFYLFTFLPFYPFQLPFYLFTFLHFYLLNKIGPVVKMPRPVRVTLKTAIDSRQYFIMKTFVLL